MIKVAKKLSRRGIDAVVYVSPVSKEKIKGKSRRGKSGGSYYL